MRLQTSLEWAKMYAQYFENFKLIEIWMRIKHYKIKSQIDAINSLQMHLNYELSVYNSIKFDELYDFFDMIDERFSSLWVVKDIYKIKIVKSAEPHEDSPKIEFIVKDKNNYISTVSFEQLERLLINSTSYMKSI